MELADIWLQQDLGLKCSAWKDFGFYLGLKPFFVSIVFCLEHIFNRKILGLKQVTDGWKLYMSIQLIWNKNNPMEVLEKTKQLDFKSFHCYELGKGTNIASIFLMSSSASTFSLVKAELALFPLDPASHPSVKVYFSAPLNFVTTVDHTTQCQHILATP